MDFADSPRPRWPVVVAVGFMLAFTGAVGAWGARANGWHFAYALDDAYIHLATARNFAAHGVWGVTQYEFAPATSSLLWPLLLSAIHALTGWLLMVPLALNLALGAAVLAVCDRVAGLANAWARLALLLAIVVCGPFPVLLLSGMETMLHVLLAALFLHAVAGLISSEESPSAKRIAMAATLAAALVATRFEGLFLAFPACVSLLWRRRWVAGIAIGAAAWVPVAAFAAYSIPRGGMWLPNPVLLKSASLEPGAFALNALVAMWRLPLMAVLLAGVVGCWWIAREPGHRARLAIFGAGLLLHMQFARTGHLYRYEAYLVILAMALIAPLIPWRNAPRRQVVGAGLIALLAAVPMAARGGKGLLRGANASIEIYAQQWMMGSFLAAHYNREVVAANDIGAIAFLTDVHLVDLWGLADTAVARARMRGEFDGAAIGEYLRRRNARIAVCYPNALGDQHGMIPVASWTIPAGWAVPQGKVAFFAADEAEAARLDANLREFAPRLPARVVQHYERGGAK